MSLSEIKTERSYIDPLYNFQQGDKTLCIQLGLDALSIAVFDKQSNTCVAVREYFFDSFQSLYQVKEASELLFDSDDLLQLNYSNTLIAVIGEHALLVPNALHEQQHEQAYIKFSGEIKNEEEVRSDQLLNIPAKNVYSITQSLIESLRKRFINARIMHYSSPLIDQLALRYKNEENPLMVLHIQYSHFEVLYLNNGKLNLFNSFTYTTAEDLIYYVLFVIEQLSLSAEKVQIEVIGEIDEYSNAYRMLLQYVRNVRLGNRSTLLKYSEILDAVPAHYYSNLFHQFLCE